MIGAITPRSHTQKKNTLLLLLLQKKKSKNIPGTLRISVAAHPLLYNTTYTIILVYIYTVYHKHQTRRETTSHKKKTIVYSTTIILYYHYTHKALNKCVAYTTKIIQA